MTALTIRPGQPPSDRRSFTLDDQISFAEHSGDYNPLHIDPVVARRLIYGSVVVHGLFVLLWSLEKWLGYKSRPVALQFLRASFQKPVRIDEEVRFSLLEEDGKHVRIKLSVTDSHVLNLEFAWEAGFEQDDRFLEKTFPQKSECRVWKTKDWQNTSGRLPLHLNRDAFQKKFPSLSKFLPPQQLAPLLATTRLVGMECPGLHSIYSGIDLQFDSSDEISQDLRYSVTEFDDRVGLVSLDVVAPTMKGTLTAFVRPPLQEQASFDSIKSRVQPNEFAGQNSLVIGGSRGLGEAVTKILCAGGASVDFTYFQGKEDAYRLAQEIRACGNSVEDLPLDILDSNFSLLESLSGRKKPTHLYFFASPFISAGKVDSCSPSLFQKFCDYYVRGFSRLVEQAYKMGIRRVFYPSSIYLDAPPRNLNEYVAAKTMGENLSSFLETCYSHLAIYKPRLPKMATDQTAALLKSDVPDPVPILLDELRRFNDLPAN